MLTLGKYPNHHAAQKGQFSIPYPANLDRQISAKTVQLQYHSMWKIDINTGLVSFPTTKKRYQVAEGTLSRRSIGVGDGVTFHNVTGTGSLQWLSLNYRVSKPLSKEPLAVFLTSTDECSDTGQSPRWRSPYPPQRRSANRHLEPEFQSRIPRYNPSSARSTPRRRQ